MSSDPIEQFLIEEAVLGADFESEQAELEREHSRAAARERGRRMLAERQGG